MTYTKDTLRQIFQQPFSQQEWQTMLQNYFHASELRAEPEPINGTSDDEKGLTFKASQLKRGMTFAKMDAIIRRNAEKAQQAKLNGRLQSIHYELPKTRSQPRATETCRIVYFYSLTGLIRYKQSRL